MNQENHIITGYSGYSHIYAVEDRIFNEALFGEGLVLFDCYYMFELEYLQDEIVRIHSGQGCYEGMRFGIRPGEYEDIKLKPFEEGMNRNDILCAHYHKEALTGTEIVAFETIPGEASTEEPVDPEVYPDDGSLISGTALNVWIPLWRIKIRGLGDPTFERMPATISAVGSNQSYEYTVPEKYGSWSNTNGGYWKHGNEVHVCMTFSKTSGTISNGINTPTSGQTGANYKEKAFTGFPKPINTSTVSGAHITGSSSVTMLMASITEDGTLYIGVPNASSANASYSNYLNFSYLAKE